MPCYHPLSALRTEDGRIVMSGSSRMATLQLPCGQCVGCRLERSKQWAIRCMHEASLYPENSYITLTYSPQYLPEHSTLVYKHYQDFMKRLRKHFKSNKSNPVRFYMCGEYGDLNARPHYHAILFNVGFTDLKYWQTTPAGFKLYTSATLSKLWPFGHSSVGAVSFESAAYVARYVMKKQTGKDAHVSYAVIDHETGEVLTDSQGNIISRVPEFNKMSNRPGIGFGWLFKYVSDVYPRDSVLMRNRLLKVPRYYDKIFKDHFPQEFALVRQNRIDKYLHRRDNTYRRLQDKEQVALASLSKLKRGLLKD